MKHFLRTNSKVIVAALSSILIITEQMISYDNRIIPDDSYDLLVILTTIISTITVYFVPNGTKKGQTMRVADEVRNVLELFNNADQNHSDSPEVATRTEAILNTLQWVYWEDISNSVILRWLPSDPSDTTPAQEPLPLNDTPPLSESGPVSVSGAETPPESGTVGT